MKPTPDETFIWVVTRTDLRWLRADLGTAALMTAVQSLRCGLDEEEWATPSRAGRCAGLLGLSEAPASSQPLPFDLGKAHALYKTLFGRAEDLIRGKRLIVVPSGPLTSLPFQVLVAQKPQKALPGTFAGYRDVAWLGTRNAIVTLPAVSSLKALRQRNRSSQRIANTYAGYGNPVLQGDGVSCQPAKAPESCPVIFAGTERPASALGRTITAVSGRATIRGSGSVRSANASIDGVFERGASADAVRDQVRQLCPLPDTAYEIKCVASRFRDNAATLYLAGDASETSIKALSADGKLAGYGILHFATHGLLSGDVERMAQRQGEPALVLTPPENPASPDDDGLLTASEVTGLKLNANWVVLSACNTAAGDKVGAQALSGLARAFFYAGGRALLVSHWPVYSDAAVRLTTRAFAELQQDPRAGRAEAMQHAMIALMSDHSQEDNAHPAVWAPFVVVGEPSN
jgi:CHAT domain-containing protein